MKKITQRLFEQRIFRFALTGGMATLIHICVAFLLLKLTTDSVLISNMIGFLSAFLFSYLIQSTFVFHRAVSFANAKRFLIVQTSAFFISQFVTAQFHINNRYLATLIIVFMIPLFTYLIHHFWTFRQRE